MFQNIYRRKLVHLAWIKAIMGEDDIEVLAGLEEAQALLPSITKVVS